jgi:hypothetical protein
MEQIFERSNGIEWKPSDVGLVGTLLSDTEIKNQHPEQLGKKNSQHMESTSRGCAEKFPTLRAVVLLKADDLTEVSVLESETILYLEHAFSCQWNDRDNLEGLLKETNRHTFTWQPHGSQFTIIEQIPDERLKLRIRKPPILKREQILDALKVDDTWIEIVK